MLIKRCTWIKENFIGEVPNIVNGLLKYKAILTIIEKLDLISIFSLTID